MLLWIQIVLCIGVICLTVVSILSLFCLSHIYDVIKNETVKINVTNKILNNIHNVLKNERIRTKP